MSRHRPFDSVGPAFAPTVVLLHGAGRNRTCMHGAAETLSEGYHCLIPDLPLATDATDTDRDFFNQAAVAISDFIIDEAHGGRAHVVGLGIGAQLGVQLAVSCPARVRSLMLCGFRACGTDPVDRRTGGYPTRAPSVSAFDAPWLLQLLRRSNAFRVPEPLQDNEIPTLVAVGDGEAGGHRSAELLAPRFCASSVVTVPDAGPGWYARTQRLLPWVRRWLEDGGHGPSLRRRDAGRYADRPSQHLHLVS